MNGKKFDVLIEEMNKTDPQTGIESFAYLELWADEEMKDVIMEVNGVYKVMAWGVHYFVDLDPRYDREWVKAEIEAAIKCAE